MTRKLLLATRNQHKKRELQTMLADLNIQVMSLDEVPELPEVEEDGHSFAANAAKKARVTAAASGLACLADDSGLVVDALNGQPGIYSARFAGPQADDRANNRKLLQMMEGIPEGQRTAHFVCSVALVDSTGSVSTVEGSCPGRIIWQPQGEGGFGYDPLFVPEGYSMTFAQIPPEEKNRISHRARALALARPVIEQLLF